LSQFLLHLYWLYDVRMIYQITNISSLIFIVLKTLAQKKNTL